MVETGPIRRMLRDVRGGAQGRAGAFPRGLNSPALWGVTDGLKAVPFKTKANCIAAQDVAPAGADGDAEAGFTLFELLLVMMIIAILATLAIPQYKANVQAAKEAVLRADLRVMRDAIGSYTVDKQKAPQSLDDLVSAGYIRAIPKEPISGRTDCWVTAQSEMLATVDETDSGGVDDVHSCSQQVGLDGTSYNTW